MEFEFDPAKSASNKDKHGIDFVDAQNLWLDQRRLIAPLVMEGEERYIMIARLHDKIWSTIFTYRGGRVRIISVRRARDKERQHYENDQC
ncbi:BrnT family toxin [Agrobacterium larrymoorei]|uniref:BrnT family toxin n=1 Tax=Agrobacterium larrymoorei TaxID=160699 RepID=A0AAF0KEJ9_9HYPH|nr:BrnT family toxin [Agrobacterium larrymoorei]WHA41951.1 BrnT family toxin [Agrobacterium larrymoorei]